MELFGNDLLMVLCEVGSRSRYVQTESSSWQVALGRMNKIRGPNPDAQMLLSNKDCTKGVLLLGII